MIYYFVRLVGKKLYVGPGIPAIKVSPYEDLTQDNLAALRESLSKVFELLKLAVAGEELFVEPPTQLAVDTLTKVADSPGGEHLITTTTTTTIAMTVTLKPRQPFEGKKLDFDRIRFLLSSILNVSLTNRPRSCP